MQNRQFQVHVARVGWQRGQTFDRSLRDQRVAGAIAFRQRRDEDRRGASQVERGATTDAGWLEGIDRPVVLVATSTERLNDASLGLVAIEAVAAEPVHVVATFPCGVPEGVRAMSMVDGARRVAEGFAATGGVGRGADLLESRLLAR